MKEQLKILIELQACDNRIQEIQRRNQEGPLRLQKLRGELADVDEKFKESQNLIDTLKKDRKKMEAEVQELEGKAERSGVKLSSVKTNKEYTAALKEIEDLKSLKTSAEDRVIQLMEEMDRLEKQLKEHKEKKKQAERRMEAGVIEIEKELGELNGELKGLEKGRTRLTRILDKGILKKYLLLMERRNGKALSAVIRGVCQTCHLGFPPQRFNELLKGDSLITCPNCNRLLYWGEDQDFQTTSNKV